ncbi:MAG TPA: glycine--tRNA ligase subunit beta [Stellaceae bacterium]|jgi:glycyl-tRNA synthetase beta chain
MSTAVISEPQAAQPAVGPRRQGELLIELLSEEIPARMQRRAIEDLTGLVRDKLAAAEIPAASMRGYVTPRRLAVVAEGIPATQPDRSEERRGPRLGAPPAAIEGFLRSAGLGSPKECEIRDTGRGEFYFAVIRRSGRPAAEVLPELIKAAIAELSWPKSMRWPGSTLRWVRPLTSIICLYDGAVLPLAIDGVPVGRTTRGHRLLAPGEICVADAAEYAEKLDQAYVVLDQHRRTELIRDVLDRRAAELGVAVKPDPGLLDEVTGLAEFPVVLAGAIDPGFMTLPPEVLQTAMRTHQKYFSGVSPDGRPAPHFLFVANNLAEDGGAAIVAGNERVLRARLADARFFWDQDRKVRLEDRVEALKDRVYHAKLGSVYDKVERMERIAQDLVFRLGGLSAQAERACRAARLAKADLSTGMVGEFPELQGIMGRYYALHDGEVRQVADAIAEHYRPLGPNDNCPTAPDSIVVALADKLDTVASFFRIGERPTGSGDPFALRRAAQGIIRIILENRLRLPLPSVLSVAAEPSPPFASEQYPIQLIRSLMDFIADRLWVQLRGQGVRHDLIAAVFAVKEEDLVRLLARVDALAAFLGTDDGSNLLTAYRRASNIVSIEEERDKRRFDDDVYNPRGIEGEERALLLALNQFAEKVRGFVKEERFEEAMAELARLRRPVDEFFDRVTVNTDMPELRENRLRLLARIRATMNQVADFSLVEG